MSFTVKLVDDLPAEIMELIARINVRHGQLEHVLMLTIHRSSPNLSLLEAMAKVQELLSLPALSAEALRTYGIATQDQEAEGALLKALDGARAASRARQDVVHALWAYDEEDKLVWQRGAQPLDVKTLPTIHLDLKNAVHDVNAVTRPDDRFTSTGGPNI